MTDARSTTREDLSGTLTSDGRGTLAERLAGQLRRRIQESDLQEGDFFATEAELAEQWEVSRTVVREAVGQLKSLGILEGRKRKGLIVRRPDPLQLLTRTLPSLLSSEADLQELAMLRYALEVGAIELAVRNARDEQLDSLGQIVNAMEAAFAEPLRVGTFVQLDLQFHSLILEMTHAKLIAGMRKLLADFFRRIPPPADLAADADRMIWEHRQLYQAIRDRDVERARAMIRVHSAEWLRPSSPTDARTRRP